MPSNSESKAVLNLRLRADAETMELNIIQDENRIGLALQADRIDALIAELADIRSKMTPEVPWKFPHGQPVLHHQSTDFLFGLDPFEGVAVLSFRSPGLGWLSFSLPEAELDRVCNSLKEQRSRPAAPDSRKKH
jgi:hypothetical protein